MFALLLAPLQGFAVARGQTPANPTPAGQTLPPSALASPLATPLATPAAPAAAASDDPLEQQVTDLLATMAPEDRVGQLFVVNFDGDEVTAESDITLLILSLRVGGVVISPRNLNFSNAKGVDTPREVATLTNQLQGVAYGILLPPERALDPVPVAPWPPSDYLDLAKKYGFKPSNIPLLVAVQQQGDGLPASALRRGFTPLPSQMAVGATWNPDLARSVGDVVGSELRAVGANLLLGPSLDVFDMTNSAATGSLGSYSFGSSPYWVSELGRAYIAGVHAGSGNRVATAAHSFPGQGSTDRPPDEEVATIQTSLEEMRQTDLQPFVATTRAPSSVVADDGDPSSTDVLMTSHMRYSAFQGGAAGRITPISLAPELRTALTQEGFDDWRDAGGVVMSDALGVPAIRRFYGSDAQNFFNRRVALDAFLAGHDLLYLADFSLEDTWESERANIIETIGFFGDRYRSDPEFASRVDQSVRRILRLKLGLYRDALVSSPGSAAPSIPLPSVMVGESSLNVLGGEARTAAEAAMNDVAREGLTILYPDPQTQTEPLPPTFRSDDNILIFSDSRLLRECSTCTAEAAIGPDELADIITRFYGSEATGQIDPARITSLTFADLTMFLDNRAQAPAALTASASVSTSLSPTLPLETGTVVSPSVSQPLSAATSLTAPVVTGKAVTPATVTGPDLEEQPQANADALAQARVANTEQLIENADWILFAMLDEDQARYPASGAVTRFLREYGDELAEQRLVVFGLNAPYFLDATEMSRLTTYFGVYSKTQAFLENAVRGLFRAFTPAGAPPVSVPGTRFASLNARLAPDPAAVMPLQVKSAEGELLLANSAAGAAAPDQMAQAAPETPPVDVGDTLNLSVGPITDLNGHQVPDGTLVEFDLKFDDEELAMAVDPAPTRGGIAARDVAVERSGTLRVAATSAGATSGEPLLLVIVPPPAATTEAPADATATVSAGQPALPERVNLLTLLIALFTIAVTLSLFLIVQVRVLPRGALVHNMLWAAIFGLLGYLMYGLGLLPGANWLRSNISVWGTMVVVFVPMLLPLLWLQLRGEE